MTNKPMLSVELRALLELLLSHDFSEECQECGIGYSYAWGEMRALLDKEVNFLTPDCPDCACVQDGHCLCIPSKPAAQHQREPIKLSDDVREFLQEWIDSSTGGEDEDIDYDFANQLGVLLGPLYAEQPAPVADQTQCEECKGWGYHENHHEGGGTECGECSGSGKAPVEPFSGDTVVCRRYQLEQHPGQNFYHYDLDPVYGSVPVTVSELITMVESAPVAVSMPERLNTEGGYSLEAETWYNLALDDVARLNGVTK